MTNWLATAAAMLIATFATGVAAQVRHKIFLSMSYIGNDWQAQAANMMKAMAAHPNYADQVDLRVRIAGANAIVIFPISPTARQEGLRPRRHGDR